ncbi:MAG: glycosyltransferase family 4 protein [Candidatus Omnitrophica bacterium]|jgi:glycosyltransferase involved in cell wall biosynthesis|nr:glycosyltransferase family 4 protein [Candidatus Omnitrophota bacterium]
MKICLVSLFHPQRTSGGIQTYCRWLIKYFEDSNIEYLYISPFDCPKILVLPVFSLRHILLKHFKTINIIWYRSWHYFFLKIALTKRLKGQDIDIVQAHCPLSALAALKIRNKLKASWPVILRLGLNVSQAEEEATNDNIKRGGVYYKKIKNLEKNAFLGVDAIIFNSFYLKDKVLKEYPDLLNKKTIVIHNGVGVVDSNRSFKEKSEVYKFINIGELSLRKNQQFLIHLIKDLSGKIPNIELHLVGQGQEHKNLKMLAKRLRVEDKIIFHGLVQDAAKLIPGKFLYLHSALEESYGIVLVEAMSHGVIPVSFAVGGAQEIIKHGYNGFLVSPGDIKTYAEIVTDFILDKEKHAVISNNAREEFRRRFDYKLMGEAVINFYKILKVS